MDSLMVRISKKLLIFFGLIIGPSLSFATQYFVAAGGSDLNNGLTSGTPFATIAKATTTSTTNDTISLNGGDTFNANVAITSYRTFNSYGTGQAIVNGGSGNGIASTNCGMTVTNLTVMVATTDVNGGLYAIVTTMSDNATHNDGVIITSNTITGGAVSVRLQVASGTTSKLNHILIQNNTVSGANSYSLFVTANASTAYNSFSDVSITSNTVFNVHGSSQTAGQANGIVVSNANTSVGPVLIQQNHVYNCGYNVSGPATGGPAAIFFYCCDGAIAQFNVAHDIYFGVNGLDGCAFDIDLLCTSCTFQYNFGYNCQGCGMFVLSGTGGSTSHNVFRFNICINTCTGSGPSSVGTGAIRVTSSGAYFDIYNNTVFSMTTSTTVNSGVYIGNLNEPHVNLYNNLVIVQAGAFAINMGSVDATFHSDHNVFQSGGNGFLAHALGSNYTSLSAWRTATGKDAGSSISTSTLVLAAAPIPLITPQTLALASAYAVLNTSTMAQVGADLNSLYGINPGTQDILGYPLTIPYSVGACAFSVPALTAYHAAVFKDQPVLWERANELTGTTTSYDSIGTLGTGTYYSTTLGLKSLCPNDYVGGSASYNGSTSYEAISSSQSGTGIANMPLTMSVELWIQGGQGTIYGTQSWFTGFNGTRWNVFISTSGQIRLSINDVSSGKLQVTTNGTPLDPTKNYHIVLCNPTVTTIAIYVNGVAQSLAAYAFSGPMTTGTSLTEFDVAVNSPTIPQPGTVAEVVSNVSVYGKALTAAQALAHFQAGTQSPSSGFLGAN